jgi:hypothetical protein
LGNENGEWKKEFERGDTDEWIMVYGPVSISLLQLFTERELTQVELTLSVLRTKYIALKPALPYA